MTGVSGDLPSDQISDMLTITVSTAGGETMIHLVGEIDASTAPDLAHAVTRAEQREDLKQIVLDMGGVRFLDSAGLRVIIRARNAMLDRSGSVRIVNASGVVARVLEITGIDQVLNES